jgi:hypothetical protein
MLSVRARSPSIPVRRTQATNGGRADASADAEGGVGGGSLTTPGSGGVANATADAVSSKSSSADATATGGAGGSSQRSGGAGGDATGMASSVALGSGTSTATATATGGAGGLTQGSGGAGGDAAATSTSTALGGGASLATSTAAGGVSGSAFSGSNGDGAANANSSAATRNGAVAQAQSTAIGSSGQAKSTAQTDYFDTTLVQSTAVAEAGSTATTIAIVQAGGSGQVFGNPAETAYAFSTAFPNKAYASSLIGGAGSVAGALLKPGEVVFGTAILGANYATDGVGETLTYSAISTFDFGYRGDVLLGLICDQQNGFIGGLGFQSLEFYVLADGVKTLDKTFTSLAVADTFFQDQVIDLGSTLGPNVDLTVGYNLVANGAGGFGFDLAVGDPVPEPSTWVMMGLGLAALGFAGRSRSTKRRLAITTA